MSSPYRDLVALPVYNEVLHVAAVLDEVVRFAPNVLVVDDGSTDGTREELQRRSDVIRLCHPVNLGYGAALKSAFDYAIAHEYDFLVTIDCDGQHEPQRIPEILAACRDVDIASGSRYLTNVGIASRAMPEAEVGAAPGTFWRDVPTAPPAPIERRRINHVITQEINCRLGLDLTDAFCGFKAYRVAALGKLTIQEPGYAMPLELWVQSAHHRLRIIEVPVPLIYLEEKRSFGGALDDGQTRLNYYHDVLDRAIATVRGEKLQRGGEGSCIEWEWDGGESERGRARSRQGRGPDEQAPLICTSARKTC